MTKLSREEVSKKIKDIFLELTAESNVEIKDTTHIANDLKIDSLDYVEIVMKIEEEFGVQIPESETENFKTFGDLVDYINKVL